MVLDLGKDIRRSVEDGVETELDLSELFLNTPSVTKLEIFSSVYQRDKGIVQFIEMILNGIYQYHGNLQYHSPAPVSDRHMRVCLICYLIIWG
jgi:hypothetical protein